MNEYTYSINTEFVVSLYSVSLGFFDTASLACETFRVCLTVLSRIDSDSDAITILTRGSMTVYIGGEICPSSHVFLAIKKYDY